MKKIDKLKNNFVSRNIGLAKLAYKTQKSLLGQSKELLKDQIQKSIGPHIDEIVNELALMKGPVMKVGQLLSVHGKSLFPDELAKLLQKLEGKTYFLAWDEIKKKYSY